MRHAVDRRSMSPVLPVSVPVHDSAGDRVAGRFHRGQPAGMGKRETGGTMDETDGLRWFKSSASGGGGCVEAARTADGGMAVRDTKDRAKAAHFYTRDEWQAFVTGAKKGEFDLPA
jgi:hypothetical protein